jgi:penicillin-binding protein 1B
MFKPEPRYKKWLFALKIILLVSLISSLVVGSYFFYLYSEIRRRFESRRWSIPSTVFSATAPIYPGQSLSLSQMKLMLEERRYQEARSEPLHAGEYMVSGNILTVYLREFKFPGRALPSQRAQFEFAQNSLYRIRGNGGDIAFLEMEPLEIARLFGEHRESRLLVSIRQVPRHLIDAVVAIEDHRFYEHGGVDAWGVLRALWTDLRARRVVQGGSTITQQLVKNYFLDPTRNLKRKVLEASMALVIEALYDKNEILEMYFNEIYLGQRGSIAIHGIGEASRYLFGRNVEDVTLAEAATLAGIIRTPNSYSPLSHPDRARERRNVVLKRMLDLGKIRLEEYDRARCEPLRVPETILPVNVAPYFVDYVRQQLQDLYAPEVLESQGLTIHTTLHPEMATAAVTAIKKGIEELEREHPDLKPPSPDRTLQALLIAVQPRTGAVLAMVGGRDYGETTYNRVLYSSRQPGSAIKPFIYLNGLDRFTPASRLDDDPLTLTWGDSEWTPQNYDGRYRGQVSFRQALEESLNVPTVNLAMAMGLNKVISTLRTFGFQSPLEPMPSLALGAFEVKPLDLISAYAALDNDGQKPFLLGLKEVVTEEGEIQERRNVDLVSVTTPAKAYIITSLLQGAIQRGTARNLGRLGIEFPCAGKTGTTSDYRDSWFVGYTTDLVALVWVGFDDNRSTHLTGAHGAARIWARFINEIRPWIHSQPFRIPPGVEERFVCDESGQLATTWCPAKRLEVFLVDQVPKIYCTLHDKK